MEEQQPWQQLKSQQNDVHFLQKARSPAGGLQEEDQLNQPCLDLNGKPFWPKINTAENGAPIQSLQEQDFQY
jgi:hypothetical protein